MNWIPQVSSGYFAIAGLVCAAGPVLIHLLNRRRYRIVDWAAMEFLLQALQRQKRRLRLRDLLLLLLRTAAVLLFGLALARPFFTSSGSGFDASSPRHLILLLDNSLSMGYRPVDQTLLDEARQQAGELIDALPDGSQVTIAGVCGTEYQRQGPLRRKEDARELLAGIRLVDGTARVEEAVAAASSAIGAAAPLPDQIVYFTDMQDRNWPTEVDPRQFDDLPTLQIRDMSRGTWDNSWVSEVRLRDDVVDLDAPATVFVTVRHQGPTAHRTQVTLSVHGRSITSRNIEFASGQYERQLVFECLFSDAPVEPGDVAFMPLEVSLTPDRLEQDDQRAVMVPVVASLPVVFVDRYASGDEDPALGRLGETRPLRHLLAPSGGDRQRPLVDVRHATISQVDRTLLATARLVVVAGIEDPGPAAGILRQYVEQGGPLVIAAGGDFDPMAWNLSAGPQAAGLIPGRLDEQMLGMAPDEAGDRHLAPFSLSYESMANDPLLRLPGLSNDELKTLYREPLFFKAVQLDMTASDSEATTTSSDQDLASAPARWLAWQPPSQPNDTPDAVRSRPSVAMRLDNPQQTPLLVHRRIGNGQMLFAATSLLPTWNNLAQTNAVVLWDHLLRSLIRSTLPRRSFHPQDRLSIPLGASERGTAVHLQRPDKATSSETVDVGFIQSNQEGVTIANVWQRGLYQLEPVPARNAPRGLADRAWRLEFTVNGDAAESDLARLPDNELQSQVVQPGIGQLLVGDSLGEVRSAARGSGLWWWLTLSVFLLLIAELIVLFVSTRAAAMEVGE